MGQPKFPRKKYDTPNHPWQGDRIKEEHEIVRKFGLSNKREIWKAQTRLREVRGQARGLVSRTRVEGDSQANKEAGALLIKLYRQGYTGEGTTLNEVLGLELERILNRRLQSQVYLKGMARTMKQARQFVNHGCILIGDRRVTVPSYVVRREEEDMITFDATKSVASEDHPVRPKAPGQELVEAPKEDVAEAPEAPEVKAPAPAKAKAPAAAKAPEAPEVKAPAKAKAPAAAKAPAEPAKEEAAKAPAEEAKE